MRYLLCWLILIAFASAQVRKVGPQTTVGPNTIPQGTVVSATVTLIQKVAGPACGNTTTCSGTITAIGAGHALIFINEALKIGVVMSSINTGGTLVPCGGGAANTGGNLDSSATALSISCGWVLSTSSSSTTMTVTNNITPTQSSWTMYEYACSGGTVSHDTDNAAQNGTDTTPYNGVTLSITGTNDFILQGSDGLNTDPTAISGPYTDFLGPNGLGLGTGDLLNSTSGTAPTFTAAGNSGGKIASAVALKCQ